MTERRAYWTTKDPSPSFNNDLLRANLHIMVNQTTDIIYICKCLSNRPTIRPADQ